MGSYVGRGLLHGYLAVQAFRVAAERGGGSRDGAAAKQASSQAMHLPFGEWLVILGGAGVVGFGLFQVYRAWASQLDKPTGRRRGESRTAAALSA